MDDFDFLSDLTDVKASKPIEVSKPTVNEPNDNTMRCIYDHVVSSNMRIPPCQADEPICCYMCESVIITIQGLKKHNATVTWFRCSFNCRFDICAKCQASIGGIAGDSGDMERQDQDENGMLVCSMSHGLDICNTWPQTGDNPIVCCKCTNDIVENHQMLKNNQEIFWFRCTQGCDYDVCQFCQLPDV